MNAAMILAGGTGTRVGASVPKQFIEVFGKPIIAYTIDCFQNHSEIDAIEIVCHKDWVDTMAAIVEKYGYTKVKWMCVGGNTFQESTVNGVLNLKSELGSGDILVTSFAVSPMTPDEDISDSIRVAKLYGNGIASDDIPLCTCEITGDGYSEKSVIRETLKGFVNPWSFEYGELLEAYEYAISNNMLATLEPHTTSLYFELGKRIWFSQTTAPFCKITTKQDIDVFKGLLLLENMSKQQENEGVRL